MITAENGQLDSHGVVVLIERDGKFLFLEEARQQLFGHWAPPHGRCDVSDTSEEATVVRETKEETGLDVHPLRKLLTIAADTKVKTVSFWLAEYLGGEVGLDATEASKYGWFTIAEALNLKLYPGTDKFLSLVRDGEIKI